MVPTMLNTDTILVTHSRFSGLPCLVAAEVPQSKKRARSEEMTNAVQSSKDKAKKGTNVPRPAGCAPFW